MPVDDANTIALLHFNGTNNSTTFTDESGKTWTARGNAKISTAQSVFGGASGLFDGTTDYIDTPDHADFNFVGTDFTLDWRARLSALPANGSKFVIFSQSSGDLNNYINLEFYNNAGTYLLVLETCDSGNINVCYPTSGMGSFSINTWYHMAVVQSGSNALFYKDGSRSGLESDTNLVFQNYTAAPRIGAMVDNGYSMNGYFDEFRISRVARWTGTTYTVPTAEYGPAAAAFVLDDRRMRLQNLLVR